MFCCRLGFSISCCWDKDGAGSMLDEPNQLTRETAVRNESCDSATKGRVQGPYGYSLVGEYSRILLLLVSLPLTVWLLQLVTRQGASASPMVAALVLVASLLCERGGKGFRAFLVVAMAVNVFSSVINPNEFLIKPDAYNPLAMPNVILLVCLAVAGYFEIVSVFKYSARPALIKLLWLGVVLIPGLVYVIGVPLGAAWLEAMAEGDGRVNVRDPNWTMVKEIALRCAKFSVFLVFTYIGACSGSFLNVVAYCIPRGEAIALRNSNCPVCKNKIFRKDNLPIFSYINLSGHCRSCQSPISVRYLIVELLIASVFGSLFLFELVTGAANVPCMKSMSHAGVLWVVLFPKWNLIGIYFYHCLFASSVVVLALIEWDEKQLGCRFSFSMILLFLMAATFYPPLQPIVAPELTVSWLGPVGEVAQLGKLVLGGLCGAVLGFTVVSFKRQSNRSTFIPAMALSGVVLGWQSVMHIFLIFLALQLIVCCFSRFRTLLSACPSCVLLVAIWVHQPFWNDLLLRFSM